MARIFFKHYLSNKSYYEEKLQGLDKISMIFVLVIWLSFLVFFTSEFPVCRAERAHALTRLNLIQFKKARKVTKEKAVSENRKLLAEYKMIFIFNLS